MKARVWNLTFAVFSCAVLILLSGQNANATAIQVNGTCEVNFCGGAALDISALKLNQSVSTTSFDFFFTFANTDEYEISGTYAASYDATNGTVIQVTAIADYVTNGTASASAADVLTLDYLQHYQNVGPGTWDGTYTESVPVTIGANVGAGTSVSADLFWDGQGVGVIGPFTGPGSYYGAASNNLTGLTGAFLDADFQYTFNFAAGAQAGAGVTVPLTSATPEPAQLIPAGLTLSFFVFTMLRRKAYESRNK